MRRARRRSPVLLLALGPICLLWAGPVLAGYTERVSVSSTGEEGDEWSGAECLSPDGRLVAFSSQAANLVAGDTNDVVDIFVHDRQTGTTERVSVSTTGEEGNSSSSSPALSADGRFVAFTSFAANLVPGDTNGVWESTTGRPAPPSG